MIRVTLALIFVLSFGLATSAQEKKKKTDEELLMGSWKLITPTVPDNGVEMILTFAKNNKLTFVVKANGMEQKADGTWELKEKKLTTAIQMPRGGEMKEEQTLETVDEKHLILKDSKGITTELARVEKKKEEKK